MKSYKQKQDLLTILSISVLLIVIYHVLYQSNRSEHTAVNAFEVPHQWLDSMLRNMTDDEKIAQLYWWQVDSMTAKRNIDSVMQIVKVLEPGGLVLNYGANFDKTYSDTALIPLIWALNAKGGVEFQDIEPLLPSMAAIEKINNIKIRYSYYNFCAINAAATKYNIYFQPLHFSDKFAKPDSLLIKSNMITSAMLWNTYFDTLTVLPALNAALCCSYRGNRQIDVNRYCVDMLPNENVHALYLGSRFFFSDSLQAEIINRLTEAGFKGYIISSSSMAENSIYVRNLQKLWKSGASVFCGSYNPGVFIGGIKQLLKQDLIERSEITEKAGKVLALKYNLGLFSEDTNNNTEFALDSVTKVMISRRLHEKAFCLYNNKNKAIPLRILKNQQYDLYFLGNLSNKFVQRFRDYSECNVRAETNDVKKLINMVAENRSNFKIVCLNAPDSLCTLFMMKINERLPKATIIINFSNRQIAQSTPTLLAIENSAIQADYAAQALWGGIGIDGVNVFEPQKENFTSKMRVKYSIPEEVGLNSDVLKSIDSLANDAIQNQATPGCQVFAIKNGQVVFNKSYGSYTYTPNSKKVTTKSMYDIASVTKIAATTLATMQMYDEGKLSLSTVLGDCFKNTNIEYTRIEPDTIITIDTLNRNKFDTEDEWEKAIAQADTTHLNDTLVYAQWTKIYKLTPSNNIFKVAFEDMLIHQSGIIPSLPILNLYLYKARARKKLKAARLSYILDSLENATDTLKSDSAVQQRITHRQAIKMAFDNFYSRKYTDSSFTHIADSMYLRKAYFDTLWMDIKQLPVHHTKTYQYSDVNMILIQQAIDSLNEMSMDTFMNKTFYQKLGLRHIDYLPLRNFEKHQIIPTVYDKIWRSQLLQGYVHDPSAAVLGGISGNAGLFASATDLGVLFQMLLDSGYYGGKQYISSETIDLFTKIRPGSKRALGFDTPAATNIIAQSASSKSYGHTGFTGCCVWVDPQNKLVYVFLSNRVHPKSKNWRLNKLKTRQKIHEVFYNAMME